MKKRHIVATILVVLNAIALFGLCVGGNVKQLFNSLAYDIGFFSPTIIAIILYLVPYKKNVKCFINNSNLGKVYYTIAFEETYFFFKLDNNQGQATNALNIEYKNIEKITKNNLICSISFINIHDLSTTIFEENKTDYTINFDDETSQTKFLDNLKKYSPNIVIE